MEELLKIENIHEFLNKFTVTINEALEGINKKDNDEKYHPLSVLL